MTITKVLFLLLLIFFTACSQDEKTKIIDVDSSEVISDLDIAQDKTKKSKKSIYYFGFDLRGEPQEDVAQYLPLLKYLHQETGFNFKLSITPQDSSTDEELCLGNTQFSILGALSFIKAHTKCDAKVLVKGLNHQGLPTYTSMFITKKGSKINSLSDLKGVKFAFGSKNSTQGYLIPRQILNENHLSLKDFSEFIITDSHQECAEAVLSGGYDVCSLQDTLAKKLQKDGLVKIIYTSHHYPSSLISVSKDVPLKVVQKIKKALLAFDPLEKNKKELYHWENTEMPHGFTEGKLLDYSLLHKLATNLGIVKECDKDVK
ncbi:phosphate/phosphite/phosphonate ABC transporter substrate-binding protein [Sulfurimonas sp. SAG-AH-194-C21]|nr:phosphate/phosphite/phosphonate ABC transporter substrate-binding protein [Sulfurimonas sp. SAG-AH-194-C21]MDF1883089.1 phosphate/phosphite/phosphonate ABC transporter substrate-binding protein [Sulfurimonas sp. SAG-AH-194-C21]